MMQREDVALVRQIVKEAMIEYEEAIKKYFEKMLKAEIAVALESKTETKKPFKPGRLE
jgi:hypothetical protein